MRNIFKKSFLLLATLVVGSVLNVFAYSHIGLANGTIALGTISKTPGAGNKFGKYQDGAYLYRGSAWSFSSGKGIKTQNSNSGVVFYLASPADITLSVMFDASKNFANVEATLYSLSDSDYDKFFTGTENSTTVTFSTTEVEKRTITIDKKATFQETFSSVGAGYYFVVCTGTGSNTYFTQLIVGGSTPVTPTVNSVTVAPASVTLEPNNTQQLTATVDATPSSADKTVTWSSSDPDVATVSTTGVVTAVAPGSATITATSNMDNTKTGTCSVTVNAPAAPIEVESISMKAATTIAICGSETLAVTYNPADANTDIALTWKSDDETIATVSDGKVTGVAAGKTTVTATTANDKSASCEVTVQAVAVTGVSLDKTSATIKIGSSTTLKATVTPDDATNKEVTWFCDNTEVATVTNGTVSGIKVGTATITVTTKDGGYKAQCTVTVQEGDPLPPTSLTLHEPGIYAEEGQKGGYGTKLYIDDNTGRAYEVYYSGRLDEGGTKLTIHTVPQDKARGITKNETNTSFEAIDGWFKGTGSDKGTGFSAKEEFNKATERCHTMTASNYYELHIKGFDQFSVYAQDKKYDAKNPSNNKYIKVVVDGKEIVKDVDTQVSIRRYDISAAEHVIRIEAVGDGNLLGGFSLREAQIPMVSHVKGNDSTQVVLQTDELKRPIIYYTKYNKFGKTEVIWEDKEATGITLSVKSSTEAGDTLVLGGQALCSVGVYPFHVSSFFNGIETKRLPSGKITVASDIHAVGTPEIEVYEGEAMEELEFNYHALSADDITLTWTNGTPTGITGYGENGKYFIGGTPTQIGNLPKDFPFTISVKGGNSINGVVHVLELVLGDNPVLYLYTNPKAYEQDGVMDYLTSKGYDFVPRKALRNGLRPAEDYKKYNWVLISEDANANNAEVLALTKQSSILPVLNMKAFAYTYERDEVDWPNGWGDPNNGSLADDGRYITIQREDHPIFKAMQKNRGSKIEVLSKIEEKGLMPIDIHLPGTHCLATSLMRSKGEYYESGDPQTFLHEIPAGMRGGKKYICMPIAISSSKNLTATGKQLIDAVVNYLLNDEPSIQIPQLQITSFTINGIAGTIDQEANKITFEIDLAEHDDIDKFAIAPQVTIASDYTHVTPASGETKDFSESWNYPVTYEVSDFINRRVYEVAIRFYSSEGIEDVYAVGDWVNIYDIFGRKVSTTNEDIYHMVLPRGIYVIVTETGEAFKIMR